MTQPQKNAIVDSIIELQRQVKVQLDRGEKLDAKQSLQAIVNDCDIYLSAEPNNTWIIGHKTEALKQLAEMLD